MKELLAIEKEVFKFRPVLEEILESFGHLNLKEYVQKHWQLAKAKPEVSFVSLLEEELRNVYGQAMAAKVISQLQSRPIISTIDHLGLLSHPIFVNSDLIYSLYFKNSELPLVLATESVSLNNTSSWSASFLWHSNGLLKRSSFLPDKFKTLPALSAPPITEKDIERFNRKTKGSFEALVKNLDKTANSFSAQACHFSFELWQQIFPSAPKLVYLPLESLVLKFLKQSFISKEPNFFSQVILTNEGRQLWQKYFKDEHTFLFWFLDSKGRRKSLKELPKSHEEILELINSGKVYPSSPLCFSVLLFAGLACVGGFTQTTWLTAVKEKLLSLTKELGLRTELEAVPTKNFSESSLAWLNIDGQYVAPSALDLYLKSEDYYLKYSSLSQSLTLKDSFLLALPTIYSVVVPGDEKFSHFNFDHTQTQVFKNLKMAEILGQAGL